MAHNESESLPTSAKAWVTYTVTDGIAREDDVLIAFTEAEGDKLYRDTVRMVVKDELPDEHDGYFPPYQPSFTDEVCEYWYNQLAEGERDTDVYMAEVEIPLKDLPHYELAYWLTLALNGALRALLSMTDHSGTPLAMRNYGGEIRQAYSALERARKIVPLLSPIPAMPE